MLIDSILYCPSLTHIFTNSIHAMYYHLFENRLIFEGFLLYMLLDQSEYSMNYIQFIIVYFIIYYYRYNSFIHFLNLDQFTHNSTVNYYYFIEIYNYLYFFNNKYRNLRIQHLLMLIIYSFHFHFLIIRKNYNLYYFLYFYYFYKINFKFNFI